METRTPRILVVDDETAVRNLVATMLKNAGYHIEKAEDGLAGWETVNRHNGEFELVITDIRMPRMDGSQLVEHLRTAYPHIKVLCMSAYADPVSPSGHYFIGKPFTTQAMRAMVRDVLGVAPKPQPDGPSS